MENGIPETLITNFPGAVHLEVNQTFLVSKAVR
jgi:hypothetical protein